MTTDGEMLAIAKIFESGLDLPIALRLFRVARSHK
jgi:hypothetical protein